jgi:hypothetical protein
MKGGFDTMAQRVAAIFHSRDDAERAAGALADLGADRGEISILARGENRDVTTTTPSATLTGEAFPPTSLPPEAQPHETMVEPARVVGDAGAPLTTTDALETAEGAAVGALAGAFIGLAAATATLTVPGFGLITAAGPLAWAIGGMAGATAGGAIVGGIYGTLRDIGIDERDARTYEERIRTGDVLMTAVVPNTVPEDEILDALSKHDAEDVSFAEYLSMRNVPIAAPEPEARTLSPDYQTTNLADQDYAIAASPEYRTPPVDRVSPETDQTPTPAETIEEVSAVSVVVDREVPTARPAAGASDLQATAPERKVATGASYAESPIGATASDGTQIDVTRIEPKPADEKSGQTKA